LCGKNLIPQAKKIFFLFFFRSDYLSFFFGSFHILDDVGGEPGDGHRHAHGLVESWTWPANV